MREKLDFILSSLDLHLVRGEEPREALVKAIEDYAEVYHTDDDRTLLQRSATVVLRRMKADEEK